jgi:glycosyltransferase involved in cell wall biosynthesis
VSPTVSVVVATYNRSGMVGTAIRSVLAQTHRDTEVIVVDDCSPDDTAATVAAIDDPRVRYVRHDRNRGLPAGRNTGIRAATGEFVAFLDDDDAWLPTKLERQLALQAPAVLCAALVDGTVVKSYDKPTVTLARLRRGNTFDPSSLMVRRELIASLGFDENLRLGEDWDAFIRIAEHAPIAYLPEPLLVYNNGAHARMTNESRFGDVDLAERLRVVEKHRSFFGEFWYRYHCADTALSYVASRSDRAGLVREAVHHYGLLPVLSVLASRAAARVATRRALARRRGTCSSSALVIRRAG